MVAGLLIAGALLSYHRRIHLSTVAGKPNVAIQNWIGPLGSYAPTPFPDTGVWPRFSCRGLLAVGWKWSSAARSGIASGHIDWDTALLVVSIPTLADDDSFPEVRRSDFSRWRCTGIWFAGNAFGCAQQGCGTSWRARFL